MKRSESIAIIGMDCRFPGAANPGAFWENLKNGVESITHFTVEELAAAGIDPRLLQDPNYIRARSVLTGIDLFDAEFFGINPKEAEAMDPQHRLFLETAWNALEHAGYDSERYAGAIGVFAGCYLNTYLLNNLCVNRAFIDTLLDFRRVGSFQTFLGNDKDYFTSRVAYKLDLRGPAVTLQTACSTSLVAVCAACQSLLLHQSDMAIAGGATITVPSKKGYLYQEGGMLSPDGRCRAFDSNAQGTVFGSGVGAVVLKRLDDAIQDRDTIHAVIRGSALNNDGSVKVSYTAPSVDGQAAVISRAQQLAGVTADTITCMEAHGTGTPLGDPIEVAGLTQAFRLTTDKRGFCAIGSVKTNIGHLDVAAGVAGLIKTVLALSNKQIPPSLHFTQPNPKIDFARSPFFVNTRLTQWESPGCPRRAGVSSFGVGGTNAHVVLEEAPPREPSGPARPWQLLVLSARSPGALDTATANLGAHLKSIKQTAAGSEHRSTVPENEQRALADVAYTLQTGRRAFEHRRAVLCSNLTQAAAVLETADPKNVFSQASPNRDRSVVFLFPGQGSQYVRMGAELYETEPVFRDVLDRCAETLEPILGSDIRRVLYPGAADLPAAADALRQTRFTQPALFAVEYALAQVWMSWGITPAAMIGHSVGEYVAGCLAGVFPLETALRLVAERARLVQDRPPGAMIAVRIAEQELTPALAPGLAIAAINGPNLCVVSGPLPAIESFEAQLKQQGLASRRLNTSHAFHSAMMDPVIGPLCECIAKLELNVPRIPYLSNLTGSWIDPAQATDPRYWARHVRETVRFDDCLAECLQSPDSVLLEVGPGATLSTLARQHPARQAGQLVLCSLPNAGDSESRSMLTSLGKLWVEGGSVSWEGFSAHERRGRLPLPTYPFERKRFWIEAPLRPPSGASEDARGGEHDRGSAHPGADPMAVGGLPAQASALGGLPTNGKPVQEPALTGESRELSGSTDRSGQILEAVRTTLHELSGIDLSRTDPSAPFLELGFDSLFLTQARQTVEAKFRVKITYRQLMEEVRTLGALASYIEAQQSASVACARDRFGAPAEPHSSALAAPAPFGPYRPVQTASSEQLTPRQRKWLEDFVPRYDRCRPASKRFAQDYRRVLADPRSVAGFRRVWKELVYQIVVERGRGARLWDIDGNEYIDLTMGFGVNLFGHSPAFVTDALQNQLATGIQIGPQSPLAGEVAGLIRDLTGMERVTFCNTGSEAVMAGLRIARAVTGRSKVAFFSGDYHGMFDEVLLRTINVNGQRRSVPIAPGIPPRAGEEVLILEYGRTESLDILRAHATELAAVLVEPVQSRHPDLQPREFLHRLRRLTERAGVVLIFDEVITGFRVHPAGAQAVFGVRADLAAYGKVLGGGLPVGALAGTGACMDALDGGFWQFGDDSSPEADMTFFAGTFVRHPLALAAARAALMRLKEAGPALQANLNQTTAEFAGKLNRFFEGSGAPLRLRHFGSLFRFDFPQDWPFAPLLIHLCLANGVYLREAHQNCFLSTAHTTEDVARVIDAVERSVTELQEADFLSNGRGPHSGTAASFAVDSRVKGTPAAALDAVQVPSAAPPSDGAFPLTDAQREVWLASQLGPEASCAYNESFTAQLSGPLNHEALRSAFFQLIGRHEALRTVFSAAGDLQTCRPQSPIHLEFEILAKLGDSERQKRLSEILQQEAATPFDLARGPVVRARVIQLSGESHLFVFTAHHLALDGWSSGVVLWELGRLYSANCVGRTCGLPPAVPFREFARLQRDRAEDPESARGEAWWLEQFADPLPVLELPIDQSRSGRRVARMGTERLTISGALYEALRTTGRRLEGTLFSILLAGFNVLLHRLSRQDRISVGIFSAGQPRWGFKDLVGHCVNMLPIRSQIEEELPFRTYLHKLNDLLLDAQDHGEFTYGRLLQTVHPAREAGRAPLVQAVFNMDRDPAESASFHELTVKVDSNDHAFILFDLSLNVQESADKLTFKFNYNADVFHADTIRRWLDCYQTLLENIASDPETAVSDLPLLNDAEWHRVIVEWNDTDAEVRSGPCIHDLFSAQARRTPHASAVVAGQIRWSYEELDARSSAVADRLREAGVGPESLVGLCVTRAPGLVAGILGILKAGGAYVPLDPNYPKDRLAFMLADAGVNLVLTDGATGANFQGLKMLAVEPAQGKGGATRDATSAPPAPERAGHLAYVLYTSGSTGSPKGIAIEHGSVVAFMDWAARAFSPGELAGVLASTSICFDLSVFELFVPLAVGGTVVLAENALQLPELPAREEVTLINTVPSVMRELLRLGALPSSVRVVNLAGEALDSGLVEEIYRLPGVEKVFDLYGPSETTTYSTFALRQAKGPAIIGRPISNTQVYILGPRLQPVPIGVPGELYIGGAGLARGYVNRPDLTGERFVRNPFSADPASRLYRTGDLARFRSDGNIEYVGRVDEQVKIRGFRVELGEIEANLRQSPAVAEAAVVVREDRSGDKRLVAYVLADPSQALEGGSVASGLRNRLRAKLPAYMVPTDFVVVETMPRLPNGKVDRRALPAPGDAPCEESVPGPLTAAEAALAQIWCDVLGIKQAGVRDNFFDLGGHSLLVTQIVVRIRERFGVDVPMRRIFEQPTISDTAAAVESTLAEQLRGISEEEAQRLSSERWDEAAGERLGSFPAVG